MKNAEKYWKKTGKGKKWKKCSFNEPNSDQYGQFIQGAGIFDEVSFINCMNNEVNETEEIIWEIDEMEKKQ